MNGYIKMRYKGGYTLMEIIIVLALISILLGIALPKTSFFIKLKEKRELEEFRKDLLFARNSAIMESRGYKVRFNIENNSYYITTGHKQKIVRSKKFKEGIRFDLDNEIRFFIFNNNGTTSNSGTLYLRNSDNDRYEIALSPVTGRVEVRLSNFK